MSYYKKHIFLCDNQRSEGERPSCGAINSPILKYLKEKCKSRYKGEGRIRIQRAGCMDRCEEGPILVSYPDCQWFSLKSIVDAERFLEFYIEIEDIQLVEDLLVEYQNQEKPK